MAASSREKPSVFNDIPGWGQAILIFVLLYVAVAVVFTSVTLVGLGVGAVVTGGAVFVLEKLSGENSRLTVLGGAGFAVLAAIVAAMLS